MDPTAFRQLLTPLGRDALQTASNLSPKEADFLIHFQSLSKHFATELARAALEIAILRGEATIKFPHADRLYLTRQALEQASSYEVSSYRAGRYRSFSTIADLGCSIGADTFSLANIAPTIGFDIDMLRLSMASANIHALGLSASAQVAQADLTHSLPFRPGSAALFFDPARRSGHQRHFSVEQYIPPLSIIRQWLPQYPALGVKISPGVDLAEVAGYDAELEFISLHGELKEAVLWFGPLKSAFHRATILPGPHHLVGERSILTSSNLTPITDPKSYLYEPDPAVIRSGLLPILAEMLGASQLDGEIAYLTSNKLLEIPFARSWKIEDWFPFQLKRLRAYLRQRDIGHVTVKKRGSPLEPELLIHKLRLHGDHECTLVLTHLRGEPIVLICNGL